MTVSVYYAPLSYVGNGAVSFAVTWPFFSAAELVVTLEPTDGSTDPVTQTLGVHYSVSGGADANGTPSVGTVTMVTAPTTSTQTLKIKRQTVSLQSVAWDAYSAFPEKAVEHGFDRRALIEQELANRIATAESTLTANADAVASAEEAAASAIEAADDASAAAASAAAAASSESTTASLAAQVLANIAVSTGASSDATRLLDDISASFNGSTTTFALTIGAAPVTPLAAAQLIVHLNGSYQIPGAGYTLFTSNIVFATAPLAGSSCAIVEIYGPADEIDVGFAIQRSNHSGTQAISTVAGLQAELDGKSALTYTPAGTGATLRTIVAKISDTLSVKDFGATGDGTTDDTTAIQACLTYAVSLGGKAVYFPAGTYVITTALAWTSAPGMIYGDGINVSIVKCTSCSGIVIDNQLVTKQLFTVEDISFQATATGTNVGITYTGNLGAAEQPCLIVNRVGISGISDTTCFHRGIHVPGGSFGIISNCMIRGKLYTTYRDMDRGISIASGTDWKIFGNFIYSVTAGVWCANGSTAEDHKIFGNAIAYVDYGIYYLTANATASFLANNNYIAAAIECVRFTAYGGEANSTIITGNVLYRYPDVYDVDWIGVIVDGANHTISGNEINALGTASVVTVGIKLEGAAYAKIFGNSLSACDADIQDTGSFNLVYGNTGSTPYSPGAFLVNATSRLNSNSMVEASANASADTTQTAHGSSAVAGFTGMRSRGTRAAPTIISSGDVVSTFTAKAYDGSSYQNVASIEAVVAATPGSGDMPGKWEFKTTPDGGTSLALRMTIDSAGLLFPTGTRFDFASSDVTITHSSNKIIFDGASSGYDFKGDGSGSQIIVGKFTDTNTSNGVGPVSLMVGHNNHFAADPASVLCATTRLSFAVGDGSDLDAQRQATLTSTGLGIKTTAPTAPLDVNGNTIRLRTQRTPASASAAGNAGDICHDASFIYVCTATNTWKRVAIATW